MRYLRSDLLYDLISVSESIFDDVSFSIKADIYSSDKFKDLLMLSGFLGMFCAFINYIIMPLVLNNYKLKYYKIFILYNKFFLRF